MKEFFIKHWEHIVSYTIAILFIAAIWSAHILFFAKD